MGDSYLYKKIYQIIKEEILSDKYEEKNSFPSERILAQRFQASHLTIRKALKILVDDGLIERKSGVGTLVLPRHSMPRHVSTGKCYVSVILDNIEQELRELAEFEGMTI